MVRKQLIPLVVALAAGASAAAGQPAQGLERFGDRVQSIFRHNSKIVAPRYAAIRTERAWRDIWDPATAGRGSVPPRPQIDFAREMVIVAAMGVRSTGGYAIQITAVRETRNALVVSAVRNWLGPRCGATAALTEPADVVRVRATAKPLRWAFRDVRTPCS